LDAKLTEPTELHCFGGFVIAEHYGLTRPTAHIDIIEARGTAKVTLNELAGKGSDLRKKHRVFIDVVTIASYPEDYESRLVELLPDRYFKYLHLRGFERHDLALAKLDRNSDRDREDVKRLVAGPGLDTGILTERYENELRLQLERPEVGDTTLALWVEMIEEVKGEAARRPTVA
jgi:hypothetical protein